MKSSEESEAESVMEGDNAVARFNNRVAAVLAKEAGLSFPSTSSVSEEDVSSSEDSSSSSSESMSTARFGYEHK